MATERIKMTEKRSILVTGAYGGMGRATVRHLAKKGYRVFALDKKVMGEEENIIPIESDITDKESVSRAFERVKEQTGNLFAVIHFAGIYMLDSLVEISDENFERIFKINLGGVFLVNKTFLPLMNRGSRILITTSELAPLDPLPFTGIYALTKGVLDKYAYSLRMELQLLGIEVAVLRSGAVDTGMLGASLEALDDFHKKTELYTCNAERFKKIVNGVEARCVSAEAIAKKVNRIIEKGRLSFSYSINRNPLLLMLNTLPKRLQLWIIKKVLKSKNSR